MPLLLPHTSKQQITHNANSFSKEVTVLSSLRHDMPHLSYAQVTAQGRGFQRRGLHPGSALPQPKARQLPPATPCEKPRVSRGLLDMPSSWLLQLQVLIAAECSPDTLTLFRTCRFLRDLILSQCTVRLRVRLPVPPARSIATQAKLQLACKLSDKVQIHLSQALSTDEDGGSRTTTTTTCDSALSLMCNAAGAGLTAIKTVVLRGLTLDGLVPPLMVTNCPQLTSLHLVSCDFTLPPLPPLPALPAAGGGTTISTLTTATTAPAPAATDPNTAMPAALTTPTTTTAGAAAAAAAATATAASSCSQLPPACSQLRSLHLHCPPQLANEPVVFAQWQLQLRSLPGLQSLTLAPLRHGSDSYSSSSVPRHWRPLPKLWLECCSAVGSQLTHLTFTAMPKAEKLPPSFSAWFPRLRHLCLTQTWIDDDDLEALLPLNTLSRLECIGFDLQRRYTERCCPWTTLCVECVCLASFDRLPLQGLAALQAVPSYDSQLTIHPNTDLASTRRAVTTLNRLGGLSAWAGAEQVTLNNRESGADSACLTAALPLLASCQPQSFTVAYARPVTAELLTAVALHLTSPRLRHIKFWSCTWDADLWPLLLPRLPPSLSSLTLSIDGLEEKQLAEICAHACRPVKLELHLISYQAKNQSWSSGWREEVRAAMERAGHQHVTIVEEMTSGFFSAMKV